MSGTEGTPRAPHTIIYVPGLSRDAQNTGEAVTASIRAAADVRGGRFAVETAAPAPEGLRATGAIVGRDGSRLVDVYEMDYRRTFERLDRDPAGDEQPPGVASAVYSAALAVWLWAKAVVGRWGRPTKSLRTRAHLLLGLLAALVLVLVALVVLYEAGAAVFNRVTDGDAWLTPEPDALLWGGLITGAMYLAARKSLLRAAAQARRVLRYHDEPAARQRIAVEVVRSVDDLLDEGYDGSIHLLAYSFGSSVVLDGLLCYAGDEALHRRVGAKVSSLVTVGCPYDAERIFFPRRLTGRAPINPDLEWRNVFIASDLFGSNFHGGDDTASGPTTGPGRLPVLSLRYLPDEELTFWSLFRLGAFRHHNDYWHEQGGCWGPVLDLWGLADPPDGGGGPPGVERLVVMHGPSAGGTRAPAGNGATGAGQDPAGSGATRPPEDGGPAR